MNAYAANSGQYPAQCGLWSDLRSRASSAPRRESTPSRGAATAAWLPDLYVAVVAGRNDEAVDMVYQRFDELLSAEQFEACDDLLRAVDLGRLNVVTMMAVVSITRVADAKLERRARVVDRVRDRIVALEPLRANALLAVVR